ncbi:hypothetical protein [Geodermatophilus sp. URMC 64]
MGRHTAADGTSVHPLVAEGLSRRTTGTASHSTAEPEPQRESEVGWPAPPNRGRRLGWPGDLPADGEAASEEPAPPARRGWRRLFGARSAA